MTRTAGAVRDLDLSIVVVNWNVRDLLRECLRSVRRETRLPRDRYEVHVVDNASVDGSVEMVRAEFPDVLLTANEQNVGFACANNQVLSRCRGRYLMALNPDTVVGPGALDNMLASMDRHPETGILGCRLLNTDHSFQRAAGGAFPSTLNVAWNYLFLNRLLPKRWAPPALFLEEPTSGDHEIDWVCGAAMMIRSEAVGERLFDESFFMFAEDMELCDRVRGQGWRVVHTDAATIVHHHGQSMAQQDSQAVLAMALKGPRTFYVRRNGRGLLRAYDLILLVGYLIRWPAFALLSLGRRGQRYRQLSSDSRRHAREALRLLLNSDSHG